MRNNYFGSLLLAHIMLASSVLQLQSSSLSMGNYSVNASANETGDLTVQGEAHIGGDIDFGTTGTVQSAALFHYSESGTNYSLILSATRPGTAFFWQDNEAATPNNKMSLGADNALSLFDATGAAGIVLSPATGLITLAGSGSGIRLADGTILSTAASLRSSSLFTTNGTVSATVTPDGKVNFANGITIGASSVATGTSAFAIGNNAAATGSTAAAFGELTIAQSYDSLVLGRFNIAQGNSTTWVGSDDLFVIGNGVSLAAPSNALVVKKSGDTKITGKLEVTGRSKIQVEPQGDLLMGSYTAE